ncbi:hypothetical protein [Streptacidiphilus sp. P02-A3a]|uniref:hypothetical protein n=1 Tax=Streptacidiphilus sp. P02-A3a TaxID=2704468 RepID=UPI0015FE66BF|nr:hypothetical protein [Streptacidiphilus sp. P02-A3a]
MPDPTPLLAPAERLADRFRSMPQSKLTRFAPFGLRLARRLAVLAQQLEGLPVRELPEAGVFAVGDQIALAAHDLAAALAGTGSGSRSGSGSQSGSRSGAGSGFGSGSGSGVDSGSDSGAHSGFDPGTEPEAEPEQAEQTEQTGAGEAALAEALGLVAELAQRLATTRSAMM